MAKITKVITLTEKNDSGPLYDLYWSSNNGLTYTSSEESRNLYLPYVGASAAASVDDTATTFKLQSRGGCVNSVISGSTIVPTSTPTPTPSPTPLFPYPTPTPTSAGPTPTPTPTAIPSSQFGYHTIIKSGTYQHKSVWQGSGNAYNAANLVTFLTGQSSPAQNTNYNLTCNYTTIKDGSTTRGIIQNSTGLGTVKWFYDGIQVVVQLDDVILSGDYILGPYGPLYWTYYCSPSILPTPTPTSTAAPPTSTPTPSPTPPSINTTDLIAWYEGGAIGTTIINEWQNSVGSANSTIDMGTGYVNSASGEFTHLDNVKGDFTPSINDFALVDGVTIEAWVRFKDNADQTENVFAGWNAILSSGPWVGLNRDQNTNNVYFDNALNRESGRYSASLDTWYHVVGTAQPNAGTGEGSQGDVNLYVNSINMSTVTGSLAGWGDYDNYGSAVVNRYPVGTNSRPNNIDIGHFRIYKRPLSGSEILSNFLTEASTYGY